MKISINLLITISILFSFCINSCSSDEAPSQLSIDKQISEYNEKYLSIGKLHNQVLDSVFKNVQNNSILFKTKSQTKMLSNKREDILNIFQDAFSRIYPSIEEIQELYPLKIVDNKSISLYNKNFDINYLKTNSEDSYSENLKSYIEKACELMDIHGKTQVSVEIFNNDIDKLSIEALSNIQDPLEIEIYFIGMSIAKASYEYWLTNESDWENLIKEIGDMEGNQTKKGYSYSNVGKEDVKGGVIGGLGGAIVGGIGAGPGALGGACTASIAECVSQLWDNWF